MPVERDGIWWAAYASAAFDAEQIPIIRGVERLIGRTLERLSWHFDSLLSLDDLEVSRPDATHRSVIRLLQSERFAEVLRQISDRNGP